MANYTGGPTHSAGITFHIGRGAIWFLLVAIIAAAMDPYIGWLAIVLHLVYAIQLFGTYGKAALVAQGYRKEDVLNPKKMIAGIWITTVLVIAVDLILEFVVQNPSFGFWDVGGHMIFLGISWVFDILFAIVFTSAARDM